MNLNSTQDKILLKNCILVKLKQLELTLATQRKNGVSLYDIKSNQDNIRYYSYLYDLLKSDDTETLIDVLKSDTNIETFKNFNQTILSLPANEIAKEYIDLTKTLMIQTGVYSDKKFLELKKAFYKGNENLISSTNYNEFEEEKEENSQNKNHSTKEMQDILELLNNLIKKYNPRTMTTFDFKDFSKQFKDLTYKLGKLKFQQSFSNQDKANIEDMSISYDISNPEKPAYRTDFKFDDSSNLSISEPASNFSSTYYQNLCYAYLESDKYSKISIGFLNNLSPNILSEKMYDFNECYRKLRDMIIKCKITINGNKIFVYDDESEVEPNLEITEACNANPDISKDDEDIIH